MQKTIRKSIIKKLPRELISLREDKELDALLKKLEKETGRKAESITLEEVNKMLSKGRPLSEYLDEVRR